VKNFDLKAVLKSYLKFLFLIYWQYHISKNFIYYIDVEIPNQAELHRLFAGGEWEVRKKIR